MRNVTGDLMRFEDHPCLCCRLGLCEILEMQRGPDLGFLNDDKFSEKLLGLVSNCLNPSYSETGSFLPRSAALDGTLL